jgi:hypothetical protein
MTSSLPPRVFGVVWDAISMRRAIAVAMASATHNVGGIRPRDARSRIHVFVAYHSLVSSGMDCVMVILEKTRLPG